MDNQNINNFIVSTFDGLDISNESKKEYLHKIKLFGDFLKINPLNENTFLDYKKFLRDKHDISVSTKNICLTAARIVLKHMFKKGIISLDITINTKSFKQTKKHKKFGVNEDEISKISEYLKFLDQHIQPKKIKQISRIKAIFALLIFQGLRQIEIIRLDTEDIDLKNNAIFVLGKGRDDKEKVNLHPLSAQTLRDYMISYSIKSGPLFFSISNNGLNSRLTTRSLRRIVKDIFEYLDIDKSTHGFRHYFTTKLLKEFKGDIMKTRQFTRHNSLEMLMVYNDEVSMEGSLNDYYDTFGSIKF